MTYTTKDGTIMQDEMRAAIVAALAGAQTVRLSAVNGIGGDTCPNCGDAKFLYLDYLSFPTLYPQQGYPITYHDDKWWKLNRQGYPCPVCYTQSTSERAALLLENCGLLSDEQNWHLSYLDGKDKDKALDAARLILSRTPRPHGWLLLYGAYGMGKSGILKSMTAALCRCGVAARYVNAMDIILEIQQGFDTRDREQTSAAIIHRYSSFSFLAVDEIDRVNTSQWTLSILFKLLDERYNRRATFATALATNRTPESLRDDTWGYFENRTRDGARVQVGGASLRGVNG